MSQPHCRTDLDDWARSPEYQAKMRATRLVLFLTVSTQVVELAAGYWTGSLSLLTDGWHMGTHSLALGIGFLAYWFAEQKNQGLRLTFGSGKVIPLGGYTSSFFLLGIGVWTCVEAIHRLIQPEHEIFFLEAMAVTLVGLVVNLVSLRLLKHDAGHELTHEHGHHHGHGHDHNARGMIAHVAADLMTSVLALIALGLGYWKGWTWADSVAGIAGGILILVWSVQMIRDSGRELLDRVPEEVDIDQLALHLQEISVEVVECHTWRISPKGIAIELVLRTPNYLGGKYYRDFLQERGIRFYHWVIEEIRV